MVSLAQLQEIPLETMVLLAGPPGAGKSAFCEQVILRSVAVDRPIIYVTTECDAAKSIAALREQGLGETEPSLLHFVDAYSETVGLSVTDRPNTVTADCANLSSIAIAISKLQERIGRKEILLVFDSLTSPYLLSGPEVVRFMRLTLSRFTGEGNSVLISFDEGCGKDEDLVAMMSLTNGVITLEIEDGKRVLKVVKHPKVEAKSIEVQGPDKMLVKLWDMKVWDEEIMTSSLRLMQGGAFAQIRRQMGDFVNPFWLNLAYWSGMLWDPKRFPEMMYELSKMHGAGVKEMMTGAPWHQRLLLKRLVPKSLSRVNDMKKMAKFFARMEPSRMGSFEYLEDVSKTDEHYVRIYESFECWGFEDVGAATASMWPPAIAGTCKGFEGWRGVERDWNAVETKCIGLGDPYCEVKVVPGEIDELPASLVKDIAILERIHDRLMEQLMGFLLKGKPLLERPQLGSDVFLNAVFHTMLHPVLASDRSRMAMRMGGTKVGKEVGDRLIDAGLREEEAGKHILRLFEHCKVGKIRVGETIRIQENCESAWTKFMTKKREEPCCFFTTGFLNGFFSSVKNQHVKEIKCIAMGDPYCEWEFR